MVKLKTGKYALPSMNKVEEPTLGVIGPIKI
jgi:hypothetical protein